MARSLTALKRPVRRLIVVEGVALVVTLTERGLSYRVKRRKTTYSHALSALFLTAIRDAKRHSRELLAQEEMDLRVPREA